MAANSSAYALPSIRFDHSAAEGHDDTVAISNRDARAHFLSGHSSVRELRPPLLGHLVNRLTVDRALRRADQLLDFIARHAELHTPVGNDLSRADVQAG